MDKNPISEDFRRQLRMYKDQYHDIDQKPIFEDEEEEGENNICYIDKLKSLFLDGDQGAIPYFINFFYLKSADPLLEALKSIENFIAFLKTAFLSGNDYLSFNALLIVNVLLSFDKTFDISFFSLDPNVLALLSNLIDNDSFAVRLTSLRVINNILIDYPQAYQVFSHCQLVSRIFCAADFRGESSEYQEAYNRANNINAEIAFTLKIIVKDKLFLKEEVPLLWNHALRLMIDGDFSEVIEGGLGILKLLTQYGFFIEFSQEVLNFMAHNLIIDGIQILKPFLLLLRNIPNPQEFFIKLCSFGLLPEMMSALEFEMAENISLIYGYLSDIQFKTEDQLFLDTTFNLLKNGSFLSKVSIIGYFVKTLSPESPSIVQRLVDIDILFSVEDLIISENSDIIITSLRFLIVFYTIYKSVFRQSVLSLNNAENLSNTLEEIISPLEEEEILVLLGQIRHIMSE